MEKTNHEKKKKKKTSSSNNTEEEPAASETKQTTSVPASTNQVSSPRLPYPVNQLISLTMFKKKNSDITGKQHYNSPQLHLLY